MWYNHRFFKYATALLLILLIVLVFSRISHLLRPVATLLATLFAPIFSASILYYILRPIVRLLERIRFPRLAAIAATFLLAIGLSIIVSAYMGSVISKQFAELIQDLSEANYESIWQRTSGFLRNEWVLAQFEKYEQRVIETIEIITRNLSHRIPDFFSALTNIGKALLLTPFILFYLLKDDRKFAASFVNMLPEKYKGLGLTLLHDIDEVLSTYISGQMLVAFAIGILMFIGYLVIGINYPVVLAIFGMITAVIPFLGPILGILPAVVVSLTMYPFMILKVVIVMIVVQQIEGNLISPQIVGKRLLMHPLTVILLLISGASLFGFIGLLIIIPTYAVLRVSIPHFLKLYPKAAAETQTKQPSTTRKAKGATDSVQA